jgi:hypothetical protein
VSATPKQIRFTQLVKASGRPHPATLWVADPNKDPEFKKAIGENRILTIHHVNVGNKKESGEIGFQTGGAAGYLIFPKPLPMAEGTRVIGLKFDMLAEAAVKDPVKIKPAEAKSKTKPVKILKFPEVEKEEKEEEPEEPDEEIEAPAPKHEPKKTEPKSKPLSRFKITVEYTARATREIEVEAKNAAEAIQSALGEAETNLPKADWQLDATDAKRCD